MEIMKLDIDVIEYDASRTETGFSTGGEIFLTVGQVYFPSEHWYDMVFFDLKLWVPSVLSFMSGHTDSCVLRFMDGPYSVKMIRRDGEVFASCWHDNQQTVHSVLIDPYVLIKSVIKTLRKYDYFLYEHGHEPLFQEEINKLKDIPQ